MTNTLATELTRRANESSSALVSLEPNQELLLLSVRDRSGKMRPRLSITRTAGVRQALRATRILGSQPIEEKPPAYFDLKSWILRDNETVEFGGNKQFTRALLLGPSLLHNQFYANIGPPAEDVVRVFGSISLCDNGAVPAVRIEMPATPYGSMDVVSYDVDQPDKA